MRLIDRRVRVSRRAVLAIGGAGLVAASVLPGGIVAGQGGAWAMEAVAVKPETFATLVQMARDLYPHDRLADKYYAQAIASLDAAAKDDAALKDLLEAGVASLDAAANAAQGRAYADIAWEGDRVAILTTMQADPFFQKVRGHMITGLYNNQEVWTALGYEGESASMGGYLARGFNDIDWLDQA